jgi:large subunit ribosomal protein L3
MSLGLLGKKLGMTSIFDVKGNATPVTLINAGPCIITQIKSNDNLGPSKIQLAYSNQNKKNQISKPELGHFIKNNLEIYRHLKEFKVNDAFNFKLGQKFNVTLFKIGEFVNISGYTIGKGNASNIKRNHFGRGPMSHGSKHHRLQGSLGAGTTPGRVFPGKKMPGRLGMEKRTVKNLEILLIDEIKNLLIIKGCVPGKAGNLLKISSAIKKL